jgi:DNA polymerase-3 subunit gamma/tau
MMAAEMAVIRLTHVADLPDPEKLVRALTEEPRPPLPAGRWRGMRARRPPGAARCMGR